MLKEEEEYPVIEANELEEVGLIDDNDKIEEKNHEDGETLVEIAIDLPDLQTQSAPISAVELFLAPQREDRQSNDRLSSFFDHPPNEIHQGFVDNRNAKIIAEELFPSKSMSRDVWDGSPTRGVNTQHFFAKEDTAASTKIYTHGEIVFTQADPHFPLWPAIVVDYEKLPEDIQNTLPKSGGTPKRKQKMPVYFYGRNDYDIVPVERLFDFQTHLEAYRQQEVDSSLQSAYLIGLSLAEEEVRRPVEERISWLLPNSPVPNDNAPLVHAISKSRSFDDHVSTTTYVLSDILEDLLPPAGSAAAVASSRTLPSSEIFSSNSNGVSLFDNVPNGGSDPFSFNPPVPPANSELSPLKNADDRTLESSGVITHDPPLESHLPFESAEAPITNAIQASRSTDINDQPVASIKDKAIIRDVSSLFSSSSTSSANPFDLPTTTQPPPRTKPVTLERGPFESDESNSAVSSTKIKPKIVQGGANLFGNVTPADDPFGAPAAAIVKNTTSSVENTAKPKRTVPITTAGGLFDNTAVSNDPFSSSTVAPLPTIPRATSAKNLNQTKVLPTAQSLFDSNPTNTADVFSSFGVPPVAAAPVIPLAEKNPPVNLHPPVISASDVFSSAPTSSSSDIGGVFNAPPAVNTAPPLPTRGSLIPRITTPREPVKAKPAEVSPADFFGGGVSATANDPFSQSTTSINQFEEPKPQSISPPPTAVSVSAPPSVISPTSSGSSLVPTPRAMPETVSADTPPTISVPNTVELKREVSDPISEKGSSGKVGGAKLIKVKPQLASGSPFDSPTTSTGPTLFPSKDLFPPAANDPFAAIPAPAPAVHRKPSFDASNAFKNAPNAPPPAVSVHAAKSTARPVDPFGAPSRGKQVSAEDVFSKVPPPIQQPSSFDLPPAPPGVKVAPIVSPPSSSVGTPVSSGTNVGEDFASPTKTVVPAVKSKVKPKAHLMTAGGIPTPHGIVVPPTNNNAVAQAFDKPAVVPIVPVKSKQPIVNPQILTSLVEVVPEPVQVEEPVPVVEPPPQTTTVPQVLETRSNYRGGRYVKPAAAIFSVGFGGKCVTMFPDINICPPTYISASQTDERRLRLLPLNRRPSVLKVRKLLSLFASQLPSYEHIPGLSEMQQFKRLLETFAPSVPPVAEDPKKAKTGPATVAPVDYSQFVQGFIQQPITSCLPKDWLLKYFSGQSMQDVVEQEKLLWSLLEVVLKHNGQLASAEGVSNPTSPEKEIISLLLQRDPSHPAVLLPDAASPNVVTKFTSFTSEQRGQYYNRLQTLLVEGNRDDALNFSIEQQDWTTAMMLASITGPQKYQEVIRLYSQSNFISGHPLHFMMMIYSNQANKSLVQSASKNLPKFIHTVNPADAANKFNAAQQEEALFKSWKTTLAGILANKTSDWEQLVHLLGYRLQQDYKNIFGAHFAYLCANALPSDPREKVTPFPTLTNESLAANDLDFNKLRDFPLVSSSFNDKLARVMSDSLSIMALRMTEVLEHALEKSLTASSSSSSVPSSDSGNADNKSGGGFFGWIGGGSGKASSDKGKAEELSKDKKEIADKLLRLRVIMSPFKIRFALQLAEFGLTSAASSYVQQALSIVREVTALEDPKNAAKKPSVPILPFAKKFIEALDDLADRLGVKNKGYNAAVSGGVASTSSAPPTAATASSGGSGWGLSSVLSAASLKDFVDGPQPVPGVANPPRTNNNGPTAARAPPPMMPPNTNPAYPQGPPMQSGPPQAYNRHPSSGNFNNPAYPGGRAPQTNPATSTFPPQPPHIAVSNPGYPLPAPASNSSVNSSGFVEVEIDDNTASFFNNQPSTTAPPYNAYNAYPGGVAQVPPAGPSNVFNPNPTPVNAGPTTTAPSSSSNNAAVAAAQKKIRQRASQNPHLMAANQPEASPKVISSPWGMNASSTGFQAPESNNIPNNPQATKAQSGTPPVSYHPSNNPATIPANPASIPPNPGSVPPSSSAPNNQNSNNSGVSVNPAIAADAPAPKVSTPTKNTPPVSGNGANTLSAPTTGIVSNLRKGIIGWFYPDAHDATENIGKSLEAYYDDKLGRWIFPGEDNTVADAALKPPPTGPMPSSQPSSSSSSLPGMDQQKPPEPSGGGGGGGGGYDPLAALMAPPSRSVRPPSSSYGNPPTASDDPLAAMMAPRFTSLNVAGGPPGSGTPSTSSTPPVSSAGGPPPLGGGGGGGAGPPKYNVWKPKPAENASYASNPDVNSLMNQYQAQSAPLPTTTDNTTTTLPPVTTVTSEPPSGDSGMMTEISLDGEGPPLTNSHYIPPYAMNTNMNNNAYNDDAYANLG